MRSRVKISYSVHVISYRANDKLIMIIVLVQIEINDHNVNESMFIDLLAEYNNTVNMRTIR